MPIGFLTAADRARLNRFPEQIPHEDLSAFFLLSEADQQAINQQHSEAHTRLGVSRHRTDCSGDACHPQLRRITSIVGTV